MKYEPNKKVEEPVKIDLKDRKIIKYLENNSRQSYSHIAKKVGLSRESVRYRIKQLEEKGVIQDYKVVIDVSKLNYFNYHIFITLNNPEIDIEKELIKRMKSLPFVRAIIKFSGDFDFEIAMIAKNVKELDKNLTELFHGMRQYIKKQKILIIAKNYVVRNLPKNFLEFEVKEKIKPSKKIKLEENDLKIVLAMKDEADMPIYKIAEKTNLTQDIVSYRLKKMKQGKFILNYSLGLNYHALNYQVYAFLLNIDPLYEEVDMKLKEYLKNDPNILWAVKTIGEFNVLAYICTEKSIDLHNTINKIRTTFKDNIKDYKTVIMYKKYKYTFVPEHLLENENL